MASWQCPPFVFLLQSCLTMQVSVRSCLCGESSAGDECDGLFKLPGVCPFIVHVFFKVVTIAQGVNLRCLQQLFHQWVTLTLSFMDFPHVVNLLRPICRKGPNSDTVLSSPYFSIWMYILIYLCCTRSSTHYPNTVFLVALWRVHLFFGKLTMQVHRYKYNAMQSCVKL